MTSKKIDMDKVDKARVAYAELADKPYDEASKEFNVLMASIYQAGRDSVGLDLLLSREGKPLTANPFE